MNHSKFKNGDLVKISNKGRVFPQFRDLATEMQLTNFKVGFVPKNDEIGEIINCKYKHPGTDEKIYGVYMPSYKRDIMIGEVGLKLYKKRNKIKLDDNLFQI